MKTAVRRLWPMGTTLLLLALSAGSSSAADPPGKRPDLGAVEVRFQDGSVLKLVVREEKLELQTAYGKLQIPIGDIHRIEFGLRLPEDTMARIQAAIDNLTHPQTKEREKAEADLLALREKALPALTLACKNVNKEPAKRAKEVLEKLREHLTEEQANVTTQDIVHTDDSKFTGRVVTSELRVQTTQFGEKQLKVSDLHSLRSLTAVEPDAEAANVLPDPGTLVNFAQQIGKTLYFRVTGAPNGNLWGTDVYTLDSTLAMAAVHMGLVQPGKTAVIKITLIPTLPAFQGSTRNGVSSSAYGPYPSGAYRIHTK